MDRKWEQKHTCLLLQSTFIITHRQVESLEGCTIMLIIDHETALNLSRALRQHRLVTEDIGTNKHGLPFLPAKLSATLNPLTLHGYCSRGVFITCVIL